MTLRTHVNQWYTAYFVIASSANSQEAAVFLIYKSTCIDWVGNLKRCLFIATLEMNVISGKGCSKQRNKRKSDGARSGNYGGCGNTVQFSFIFLKAPIQGVLHKQWDYRQKSREMLRLTLQMISDAFLKSRWWGDVDHVIGQAIPVWSTSKPQWQMTEPECGFTWWWSNTLLFGLKFLPFLNDGLIQTVQLLTVYLRTFCLIPKEKFETNASFEGPLAWSANNWAYKQNAYIVHSWLSAKDYKSTHCEKCSNFELHG